MAEQISNYKCPSCTGPLRFDSGLGKLKCDFCDSVFSVAEIEELNRKQDEKAAKKFDEAHPDKASDGSEGLSQEEIERLKESRWEHEESSWSEGAEKMRSYNCPSCGAELVCDELTAASSCPYCGNPAIVPGQFSGALKPDLIIPFKIDREQAKAALKKYYGRKLFLPREFKAENQIEKLQGLYVPFWFFSGEAAAQCYYECTNSHTMRQGEYNVTRTDHYNVRRFGNVKFEDVPADASSKMPDDMMDSLEPYEYGELAPFSTAYLPGFMADKYDVSIEQAAPRFERRASNSAEAAMRADVRGYQTVRTVRSDVYIKRGKVKYAFLPVWLISTKWRKKNYLFAMNGQTGKFVGELPVDGKRLSLFGAALFAAAAALSYFCGIGGALAEMFL